MAKLAGDGGIEEIEDQDQDDATISLPSEKPTSTHNRSTELADRKQKTKYRRQKVQQKSSVDGTGSSIRYKCLWLLFYMLCFITGQYINFQLLKIPSSRKPSPTSSRKYSVSSVKKFFSVAAVIPFVIQVIVCVSYVATAWFVEGLTVANASLPKTIAIHSDRNDCILPEEHWKFTTAVSISSVAAIFSYSTMTVFVLIFANVIQCVSSEQNSSKDDIGQSSNLNECNSTEPEQDSSEQGSIEQRGTSGHNFSEQGSPKRGSSKIGSEEQGSSEVRSIEQDFKKQGSSEKSSEKSKGYCSKIVQALGDNALSPYNDESPNNMSAQEIAYFYINYLVLLVLFLFSCVTSLYYVSTVHSYCWITTVHVTMIVLQLVSHFSAIQSCFIFSKIVYKITKKLENVADLICATDTVKYGHREHNFPQNNTECNSRQSNAFFQAPLCAIPCLVHKEKVDKENFYKLQEIDQKFIKEVEPALYLVGVWFIVHWTLYALTTVLLSAFIIEIIINIIQYDLNSANSYLPDGEAETRAPYILYVLFFTLVNGYLFLYPCFRAAAIATARAKMINKISEKQWANIHIPVSIQTSFVQYLTSKNFAFQVPLFCASIPIGFDWVFVSFFVPVLGAYLAL